MEPIGMTIAGALGYILNAAAQSKAADTAKEEILGGFWQWIRPWFIEDVPELDTKPDDAQTEAKIQERLLELIKNETFFDELAKRIDELKQKGIKEKNIAKKDILGVRRITIGDRSYSPAEIYDRKNIIEGNIKDADEFTLGDGY